MSQHGKYGQRGRQKSHGNASTSYKVGAQAQETLEKIDESSKVLQNFRKYSGELDARKDKYERLVKLSRDITIESKRIIFLLHTIDRESKKAAVLNEAETRLEALASNHCKTIALELEGEDPYLYHRAFSPGMQEFMEAFTFYDYLKNSKFFHWDYYQNKLKYIIANVLDNSSGESEIQTASPSTKIITTTLEPVDYILGLADVTGELMRKCINNLGAGDVQGCFETCDFVRSLHTGFLTIGVFGNKEMSFKAYTLRQSLLKMEMVCYNIHVRGTEIPKHMLADVDTEKTFTDEGFFD